MNNKKILKVLSIILLLVLALSVILTSVVNAEDITPGSLTGGTSEAISSELTTLGNRIITIITTLGIVLSVIVIAILGIKYMLGSAEEKAEYKKSLMPYLIGALLVFSASTIANIVYTFFTGTSGS